MKIWLHRHLNALRRALSRLVRSPASTLLSSLVLGIALALPAGGETLLRNITDVAPHFSASPQLSVFLALEAGKPDLAAVESRLRENAAVREFHFVSREDALKELKEATGLVEIVDSLPRNPLPHAFVVTPKAEGLAQVEQLRDELAQLPKVEHVQLDSAWVQRLDAMLRFGRTALALVAALLAVALITLTFNTIRLQLLTQREEIEVSRLLGATDAYIRRPFYYFGALQGLLGGIIAWLIVRGAVTLLGEPVGELAALYDLDFRLSPPPPLQTFLLFSAAGLLGWIGAHLSVRQHLRESR